MWYTISVVHIPYMSCFSHEFSTGPQPPLVCTGHRLWSGGRRPGGIIDPAGPGPGRPRATGGGRCVVLRVEPTSARVSSPAASRGAVAQLGWCGVLPRPPSPRPRAPASLVSALSMMTLASRALVPRRARRSHGRSRQTRIILNVAPPCMSA